MNTLERLKKQGDEDADKCIRIYNALMEIDQQGAVWSSQFGVLVTIKKLREPKFFGDKEAYGYKPAKIGEIFLKGLDNNNNQ